MIFETYYIRRTLKIDKFSTNLYTHDPETLLTLQNMGEGLYAPPFLPFCFLLKISLGDPYLKILDLANLFVAVAHIKKIKKFSFTPLSEHFEKWVLKPAIAERVKA